MFELALFLTGLLMLLVAIFVFYWAYKTISKFIAEIETLTDEKQSLMNENYKLQHEVYRLTYEVPDID